MTQREESEGCLLKTSFLGDSLHTPCDTFTGSVSPSEPRRVKALIHDG